MIGLRTATAGLSLLATLALSHSAQAQAQMTVGPDSARVNTAAVPDSTRRTEKLFGMRMTRPAKAGLLSALLPGTGQIYNRKYWKLPLVYGAVGGTIYGEFFYQSRFKEFKTAYSYLTDGLKETDYKQAGRNAALLDSAAIYPTLVLYRRPRDQFFFYIGIAYALNVLDAVVDAHLRDFDISDDLSLHWEPTMIRMPTALPTPGFSLTLNLNSRRSARPKTTL
jgi:hypothetical protein